MQRLASPNFNHGVINMVEANDSIEQAQLRARMSMAVRVLARQRAVTATQQQLRSQGLKPQQFARREIIAAAEVYLAKHPALIAQAKGGG